MIKIEEDSIYNEKKQNTNKQRRHFVKTQSGLNKEKLYLDYDIYPTDIQKLRFENVYNKHY